MMVVFSFPKLLVFMLLMMFLVSGCKGEDEASAKESGAVEFVGMEVDGRVYNPDPYASLYGDVYGDSPIDSVVDDLRDNDPYATYLMGVLYYNDYPEYGIKRDLEKGRELLEEAWRMGVIDAGYSLYEVYGSGNGVGESRSVALEYLISSAEMGYVKSQVALAEDYFGRGENDYLETDYRLSKEWYEKAAELGDKESGVALAKIYYEGYGVPVNYNAAFEWMKRAENMPYGSATFGFGTLAKCYEEGIGTTISLVQAYKYYDLRGTAGIPDKERLSEQMTPEQIQEAIRLSGEWQREHNISMPNSEGYQYR
ncbi:hypothetical protein HCU01_06660 [Halomonas cupida]|uniref:Sel1 repeat-containing protein n=1 Tax=Halomonas cupida TaxID=44933 RepID=A0A1M6ZMP8_9GAMM|nr:tetratricopeptide repeat protein [Halomonas cupida]GEN22717.1 hypothetical protein HCU01_06660 [Halomonas cupida]SHL31623.1 hypothetical protein SAMN05660971_00173 [Halomonas cupida]